MAKAFNKELEFRPELWDQIQTRFQRFHRQATDNNRRQAFIPSGATPIENEVGTAPAFYINNDQRIIISLPGVPREMEHILHHQVLPLLTEQFNLKEIIKAYVLHAAGVGESQVDEWIGELETQTNPTVGLSCRPGQIDIRITAKASSEQEADEMIAGTVSQVRKLVGVAIYGSNEESLEQVVLDRLRLQNWRLSLTEYGFDGAIAEKLSMAGFPAGLGHIIPHDCQPEDLPSTAQSFREEDKAEIALAAGLFSGTVQQDLYLYLITPNSLVETNRSYGGPPKSGVMWAVNTALDFVRRNIP